MRRSTLSCHADYDGPCDAHPNPSIALPPNYTFRWYKAGDERHWLNIQRKADQVNTITPRLFAEQFGTDTRPLTRRVGFLCDTNSRPIGTAAAWFGHRVDDRPYGRLHWVAILPEWQGCGLSKPLASIVCRRLRTLGHVRATLTTDTVRLPAIRLYQKFGFEPLLQTEEDRKAWCPVLKDIERYCHNLTTSGLSSSWPQPSPRPSSSASSRRSA